MFHLFNKQPKLDSITNIEKEIRVQAKKRDHLKPKVEKLFVKMKEVERQSRDYREQADCSTNPKESSKLFKKNQKSIREYTEIKKQYLALDHQLQFALRTISHYETLLAEKQGKHKVRETEFNYHQEVEALRKSKSSQEAVIPM